MLHLVGEQYRAIAMNDQGPSDQSRRAFRNIQSMCDEHGCRLVLLNMPDYFDVTYESAARGRIDANARQLCQELRVPLMDLRRWGHQADFYDGVHFTHSGADSFSAFFEPLIVNFFKSNRRDSVDTSTIACTELISNSTR